MPPGRIEERNANYVGGDINGGVQDLGQLFTRPTFRRVPYPTPQRVSTSAPDARHVRIPRGACGSAERPCRAVMGRGALFLTSVAGTRATSEAFDMRWREQAPQRVG